MQISVVADDDSTATSLYRWLARDADIGRDIRVSPVSTPGHAGEMGADVELINAIVGNAIALGSLVAALASWRESRTTPPAICIQQNELSITIEDSSSEAVQRAIDELTRRMSDSGEAGE